MLYRSRHIPRVPTGRYPSRRQRPNRTCGRKGTAAAAAARARTRVRRAPPHPARASRGRPSAVSTGSGAAPDPGRCCLCLLAWPGSRRTMPMSRRRFDWRRSAPSPPRGIMHTFGGTYLLAPSPGNPRGRRRRQRTIGRRRRRAEAGVRRRESGGASLRAWEHPRRGGGLNSDQESNE